MKKVRIKMSKRSCINCRYLTDGIYCKARSERITSSNWFEYGCPDFEKRQQTVFDKITESVETLPEVSVCKLDEGVYYSHMIGSFYSTYSKALAATIEGLQKEYKG
jgi:hypothetical protein